MPQIGARNLCIGYNGRAIVKDVNIEIRKGERIAIIGPSGAGKTTLLLSMNGTNSVLEGELYVLGVNLHKPSKKEIVSLRRKTGIIFQSLNLVDRLHVVDNVASGMLHRKPIWRVLIKYYASGTVEEIYEYLKIVGLTDHAFQRCDRLSGGQRQRVAIARALAQKPEILLADEPISSLDPVSARSVMDTILKASETYGITVIMNLHQLHYAREYASRIIGMKNGRIVFDGSPQEITPSIIKEIYGGDPNTPDLEYARNESMGKVVHW